MDRLKEIEEVEKHNEYVMERMHPAVMIPGMFIAVMVFIFTMAQLKDLAVVF